MSSVSQQVVLKILSAQVIRNVEINNVKTLVNNRDVSPMPSATCKITELNADAWRVTKVTLTATAHQDLGQSVRSTMTAQFSWAALLTNAKTCAEQYIHVGLMPYAKCWTTDP